MSRDSRAPPPPARFQGFLDVPPESRHRRTVTRGIRRPGDARDALGCFGILGARRCTVAFTVTRATLAVLAHKSLVPRRDLPSFTEFYRVLLLLLLFDTLKGPFTGSICQSGLLPSFTGFSGSVSLLSYRFIEFYRVLPSFIGLYLFVLVFPRFTGFYRVLLGFTEFYRVFWLRESPVVWCYRVL